MKTKLTLAVLCCFTTFFVFGQTVPFPTDTVIDTSVPFPEKMDDVFGNLDLTDVTTNLLCNDKISANNLTLNVISINVNWKIIKFISNI